MLKLLTSPLISAGALALTLLLSGLLLVAKIEARHAVKVEADLRSQLDTAKTNYDRCKTNRLVLDGALNQCNAGAENTARVAGVVATAGKQALDVVARGRTHVDVDIGRIKAMPAATCEDALAILKAGAK